LFDLREVVPDVLGQSLADKEGSWMTMKKEQQVEITGVLQAPDTVKEVPDPPRCHREGSSMATLARAGKGHEMSG
jgi:hypothetical protein